MSVDPLDLSDLPTDPAERRIAFIERYLSVPRGHGVGEPVVLRAWQRDVIRGIYAPAVRQGLLSIPRGNGKSTLAGMLVLAELWCGPRSAEAHIVASGEAQALIVLAQARRMTEAAPELAARTQIFRTRLVVPERDASASALVAEPKALWGGDPSLLIVDELHVVSAETWSAATSGAGKRPHSLTLAVSTPSSSAESVMWSLVEFGRRQDDPSFFFREYAAPESYALDDPAGWAVANPAMGDFLSEDGLRAVLRTMRPEAFAQLRLGRWVKGAASWLPWGAWAACSDAAVVVPDGARVVLGFDGSASGDSTALIGCTVPGPGQRPHVWVEGLWEAPPSNPQWRVPRGEVADTIAAAFDRYTVVEISCDPYGWRSEIEGFAQRWPGRVVEWPTVPARMGPGCDRFYSLVATRGLTHDGSSPLAAHIEHCVTRNSTHGALIVRDVQGDRNRARKIDAAVGAVIAVDRAAFHARQPAKRRSRMVVV